MWTHVLRRQRELKWTNTRLQQQCGVSETTYRLGRTKGQALTYPNKIAELEAGIGWKPGSIGRILEGGDPELIEGWVATPPEDDLVQRVRALEEAVDDLLRRVDELNRVEIRRLSKLRVSRPKPPPV